MTSKTEATVLVTGMGPFMSHKVNASYLIASSLPTQLSPSIPSRSLLSRINIVVHNPAIRASYTDIRNEMPEFLDDHPEADLVVSLGIAYPRQFYTIELGARREGYDVFRDEDGKLASELTDKDCEGGANLWRKEYHAPRRLKTSIQPLEELWRRAQQVLLHREVGADLKLSRGAGNFCCGYIYYTGLVERWRMGRKRDVVFVHTKGETDEETVQEGKEVVMAVIQAAIEMLENRWASEEDENLQKDGCGCVVA